MREKTWWEKAREEREKKEEQARKEEKDRRWENWRHNSIFDQRRKDGSRGFGYED